MKIATHWLITLLLILPGYGALADDKPAATAEGNAGTVRTATFAGGCFWCLESPYDQLPGVLATTAGYTGGEVKNPTYKQVSGGRTGHTEAVQVKYDSSKVSYAELLKVFWRNIDPLDAGGQFCDRGSQYRSEIFTSNEQEKELALSSRAEIGEKLKQPVVTKITAASTFYPAEQYHQDYYQRNPLRYKYYRLSCGRDKRLKALWGASDAH